MPYMPPPPLTPKAYQTGGTRTAVPPPMAPASPGLPDASKKPAIRPATAPPPSATGLAATTAKAAGKRKALPPSSVNTMPRLNVRGLVGF